MTLFQKFGWSLRVSILLSGFTLIGCESADMPVVDQSWAISKNATIIKNNLPVEFQTPTRLSLSTPGWEDGLSVSRDGLNLYATYIPADFLSFVLDGSNDPSQIPLYGRGPHLNLNFTDNPAGLDYPWYHSDIIYSQRESTNEAFPPWQPTDLSRAVFSEGALTTVFSAPDSMMCAFTSNDQFTAQNNIKIIQSTNANPAGIGTPLTATDTAGTQLVNTNYIEDNPHLERVGDNELVLFFDSEDRPGGAGSIDIWYSISTDNGNSWSTPANVSTINTAEKEHQPHLFFDGTDWWVYFSAHHTDGKLAIFRSRGQASGWDSWGEPEPVLTAGNAAGIGEPTLTESGDLYFVVIHENPLGTDVDRYDADPWVAMAIGNDG